MLPETLTLGPRSHARGTLRPPGSKSIANRALPLAAFSQGTTKLFHLPDGDDVVLMQNALQAVGVSMESIPGGMAIEGMGGPPSTTGTVDLQLGNSGTCMRFLTAMLSAGEGRYLLDGTARMRQRPIVDLVEAIAPIQGKGEIVYSGEKGFPPLILEAAGLEGGSTRIGGSWSSQYVTALLLAMPFCRGPVRAEIEGRLVSAPYVDMTLKLLEHFGCSLSHDKHYREFHLAKPAGCRSPGTYHIEPDASSSSYFLAAGAIAGGPVTVQGLSRESLQGEAAFAGVLEKMGAKVSYGSDTITVARGSLRGLEADMDRLTDTGMTLAVTALFAQGPTVVRNVGNWRIKETDRLAAMACELRKLGADIEEGPDYLAIHPPEKLHVAEIDTYEDHRMAMSFSLACLGGVEVKISNPACTQKTYPGYFQDFDSIVG